MITENELKKFATEIRIITLQCLRARGFGHVGGSLSVVDVLAVLYGDIMKYDPKVPAWSDRDYLVMSKGHAGPALFGALALKGFFPMDWMETLCEPGTNLPSHCDRLKTPGVDVSTGSLGQGLSVAAGIAQGLAIQGKQNYVYAILGDGECDEGQIWEAVQYASHYKINNLIAFVDWNKKQVDGPVEKIMDLGNLRRKFEAFGWFALQVKGSDISAIRRAIMVAQKSQNEMPAVIVLDGIKGSGVAEYEQKEFNHFFTLDIEVIDRVIENLEKQLLALQQEDKCDDQSYL
jgi:transketolase